MLVILICFNHRCTRLYAGHNITCAGVQGLLAQLCLQGSNTGRVCQSGTISPGHNSLSVHCYPSSTGRHAPLRISTGRLSSSADHAAAMHGFAAASDF
jgi:hypothetical protein